MHITLI